MKTARRHELQTNQLANWLGDKIVLAQQYSTAIIVTILALILLIGAYAYISRQAQANEEQRWALLAMAPFGTLPANTLHGLVEANPDSEVGVYARLLLANQHLNQGVEERLNRQPNGPQTLDLAVKYYSEVISTTKQPLMLSRAMLGLGKSYESQGKIDEARAQYQDVLKRWPDTAYATEAQQRLDDIDRKSTPEFYAWLGKQKPKEKFQDILLPFDANSLDSSNLDIGGSLLQDASKDKDAETTVPGETMPSEPGATDKPATDEPAGDKPAGETKADAAPATESESTESKSPESKSDDKPADTQSAEGQSPK